MWYETTQSDSKLKGNAKIRTKSRQEFFEEKITENINGNIQVKIR